MSLNAQASAERLHIGFFGLRNAGKSSVVNAVTGQKLALVSDVKGTTTDPVQKAMEILPLGPVVIIDTPGIDDEGDLGKMRVQRALQTLRKVDVAILVVDALAGLSAQDLKLCEEFKKKNLPYIIVFNKADLIDKENLDKAEVPEGAAKIFVSALEGTNIYELKELITKVAGQIENEKKLVGDLIEPKDIIVLVTPIDESAPKGRMILPQMQMVRDVLDHDAINIVVKETELADILKTLPVKPKMVITDSQAFGFVSKVVPEDILLTSFSILFARYKGELDIYVEGAAKLDGLKDGDTVLISEGCTHHRQCNDIGTVKLPNWIRNYTGKELNFAFTSGTEFPDDPTEYALVVHCGACMLNEREMRSRARLCKDMGVPITNYGIAIAQMHGILKRSLSPFPKLLDQLF